MVTDYNGDPIQGVIVRAVPIVSSAPAAGAEEGAPPEEGAPAPAPAAAASALFPGVGVSDADGIYRVPFSLPIIDGRVDMQGRLIYNPGWEQEKANLGRAYEPQVRDADFRVYYDASQGLAAFSDGVAKVVVRSVDREGKSGPLPGSPAPGAGARPAAAAPRAAAPAAPATPDDLIKSFGLAP
jgi:hypothetical protein